MNPIEAAALERVEKALEGRTLQGHTDVTAADVALVCGLVASPDEHVTGLLKAALNNRGTDRPWFPTERLAHLVACAKA